MLKIILELFTKMSWALKKIVLWVCIGFSELLGQGNKLADYNIGRMYRDGSGVAQDF
jgi:TPR repeat protein